MDHHLERHQLLESGQSSPEELFSSRIALLPTRALLGQISELMSEAETSSADLALLGNAAGVEFATALWISAVRLERSHWRVNEAVRLLDMAMAAVSDSDISLLCRIQLAYAECQARRDYRSQGDRMRKQALEKAASLDSEARAEIFYEAAKSCLRVRELGDAREIAERILEERIAGGGRKDQWAGRALLVLAEADLKSYRLEGTETAIAMSRPSLEGLPQWDKARLLKAQSEFFLGREEESFRLLDSVKGEQAQELRIALAVWRGQADSLCAELHADPPTSLTTRWKDLEKVPLDEAIGLLELLARSGRVRQLETGLERLDSRLNGLLSTDVRTARVDLLRAALLLWERRWEEAEQLLQRVLDLLPSDQVEIPQGLSILGARSMLIQSLLAQGKILPAEFQAREGATEAAELLGEEDLRSVAFRSEAAFCAEAQGDSEDAMVLLDDVLAPLLDRLGESHVLLREIYRGLSRAFSSQGDLASARLAAEEALRIDKECRGLSLHLIEDLSLLASIERKEDEGEAANLIDTAIDLAAEVLPAEHPFHSVLQDKRQSLEVEAVRPDSLASPEPEPVSESSLEIEASLDGWTVVEDENLESFEEDSQEFTDGAEILDSAEALFEATEEAVEDSVFEVPLVDLEIRDDDSMELELTEEEAAELAGVSFESDEVAPSESEELSDDDALPLVEPESEAFVEEERADTEAELSTEPTDVAESGAVEDRTESDAVLAPLPQMASYHAFAAYYGSPKESEASVEFSSDFPPVPFRAPVISEEVEEEEAPDSPTELSERAEEESSKESVEAEPEPQNPTLWDPESWLLPLAPVFFLPIPWSEATEAAFDEKFEPLYGRFQEQFSVDGAWREVLDEAVSVVRQEPTPAAGYFLFLLGSQLEQAGRLHTADLALATAIELLEHGPALGSACHMAGRVAGRRGELRRALDYFERAAELAEEAELAVLKVDAAECHLGLGRPEEALIGFEEVFKYLNRNVPPAQFIAAAAKMAQVHLLIGDADSSQALAEDVLSRLSPKNSGTYGVLGRLLLSRAFARLGRHELALELAEEAWEGAKQWPVKRREGRRIAISNLVDIYSLVGRFRDAEAMLKESGLVGWGLAESELLLRAGHVACALGNLGAARSYLRLGQSFLTRFRSPGLWRSAFLELDAELSLQEGDPRRADQISRQALELFEQEATGPVDRSRHLVRAARIAAALGDLERAAKLAEEAHSLRDLHLGSAHPHTESVEGINAVLA